MLAAPLNTICTTARPLALTQSGSASWADSISVDRITSEPTPITRTMGSAMAMSVATASTAVMRAESNPPPSTS
jgi:hypothetical protein